MEERLSPCRTTYVAKPVGAAGVASGPSSGAGLGGGVNTTPRGVGPTVGRGVGGAPDAQAAMIAGSSNRAAPGREGRISQLGL